ncbi:hypothetical protein HY605_03775 [Candidatus Peregrinibacteria bacterium]|nr:hypothetical protein [Candidatus Peregrinibacteria bacterium]
MIFKTLQQLGLDTMVIDIYLHLLKSGSGRASTVAYQLDIPRTTAQNALLRLEKEGLATKYLEGNTAIYSPIHPDELFELVQAKQKSAQQEFDSILKDIELSMPELHGLMGENKVIPGVRLFRGQESIKKVLFDTLTSKTELKDFANIDAMFEHVKNINDEYVKEREKTRITKRSLLLDTPFAREVYESGKYSPKSHKGYKWIPQNFYPFALEMNIYDGKVSYITYVEDDFTGVIIQNAHIYQMHDSMWNLIWDLLPEPKPRRE